MNLNAKDALIGFTLLCALAAYAEEKINYQEHVLPMIPGGMTVRDIIKA